MPACPGPHAATRQVAASIAPCLAHPLCSHSCLLAPPRPAPPEPPHPPAAAALPALQYAAVRLHEATCGVQHGKAVREAVYQLLRGGGNGRFYRDYSALADSQLLPMPQLLEALSLPRAEPRALGGRERRWWDLVPKGDWVQPSTEAVSNDRCVRGGAGGRAGWDRGTAIARSMRCNGLAAGCMRISSPGLPALGLAARACRP